MESKNKVLYELIKKDSKSVRDFCKKYNLHPVQTGEILSLKKDPKKKNGEWRECSIKLSEIFKILPEDIFGDDFDIEENDMMSIERDSLYIDSISNIYFEKNFKEVDSIELKEDIEKALNTLPAREQKVIRMRYGLYDGYCHTLEEIGAVFNVGRERVRQIQGKALRRLRHPTRARILRAYLYCRDANRKKREEEYECKKEGIRTLR